MKYRPTSEDKRIIRECASKSAGYKRVEICPGERVSDITGKTSFNIAQISEHPTWDDTDLYSNSFKWSDFTKGVELTEGGRGIFDFYVYSTGPDAELKTNVTAYYEGAKLVRVDGTCDGTVWAVT